MDEQALAHKLAVLWPHLNERQRRVVLGVEASEIGHGGISAVARAAKVSWPTVSKAVKELDGQTSDPLRDGCAVWGRTQVDPDTRGDPQSPLRWTCKSTRQLPDALTEAGHPVSHSTVGDLLRALGYTCRPTSRPASAPASRPRRAVPLSVHAGARPSGRGSAGDLGGHEEKELVGENKNGGREWQPKSEPVEVNTHDLPDNKLGKAIPYGIYDVAANTGWVSVGKDHDTTAFAVATIRHWWHGAWRPLTSHEVVVDLIAATTTRTGLKVHANSAKAPTQRRQSHRAAK